MGAIATRRSWVRFAVAICALFGVTIALGLAPPEPVGEAQALAQGWEYRWTDATSLAPLDEPFGAEGWTPLTLPAHPARPARPVLWLRTRLPAPEYRDPAVAIDAVIAPFEAYVDHDLIHASPPGEGLAARTPPGVPWQVVRVPRASSTKTFALRIRADGTTALVRGTPLYGDRADHLVWTLKRDVPRLACGLVIIVIGIAGLVVVVRRNDWKVPVGYAVWTISIGLFSVNYTHAKDLLVDAPRVWFAIWAVALPAIPVGGLLFADGLFGSGPRGVLAWLLRIVATYVAFLELVYLGCTLAYSSDPHSASIVFTYATHILRIGIFVVSIVVVWLVAQRARAGNVEARIFLVGFLAHFAFSLNDLFAALGVATFSWKSMTHYGALSLTMALALILQRRYASALERAAAYAAEVLVREREKERLLRDLHDGVGGLTSNIRVLAELGQKSEERAHRSLTTIAELSSKLLAELRAFVQALDDTTTTWETLAAELRHFGSQLVSAAGIDFVMNVELTTKEAPPRLLSLHVLRVVQESITNALKQGVERVDVTLRVGTSSAEVLVSSAGGDGQKHVGGGIDLGRGLGNMRARAAEVGGTFTIERGPTTTAHLHVPLPMRLALPEKSPEPGRTEPVGCGEGG